LRLWRRAEEPATFQALADEGEPDPVEEEVTLKPSTMRGTEPLYGYVVMLELIAIAIINLVVVHGAGAPKHSQTTVSLIGLVAAIAFGATIQTRNRFIVGFSCIMAAFVIASLPQVPNSVKPYHLFGLIIPLIYALILTQRQRKASMALARSGKAPPSPTPADRRAEAVARRQQRRRGKAAEQPTGPSRSRRYTPPKAKRPRR
jgi:hypothetical protein